MLHLLPQGNIETISQLSVRYHFQVVPSGELGNFSASPFVPRFPYVRHIRSRLLSLKYAKNCNIFL